MKKIFFGMLAIVALVTCKSRMENNAQKQAAPVEYEFSADSAHRYIEQQLSFGERVPGSKAHEQCGKFLAEKLSKYCDTVILQQFNVTYCNGKTAPAVNIIASFNPNAGNRAIIASHWDARAVADKDPDIQNQTKPVPGANDGASGVAVCLEIARQLKIQNTKKGIDIIFFDAEDQGPTETNTIAQDDPNNCWGKGAQYWAQNPHRLLYRAQYGILLDMVATNNPRFTREEISNYFAGSIQNNVWNKAKQQGFGHVFSDEKTGAVLDDHYFVNTIAKIPMVDIIHHEKNGTSHFFPFWHTTKDDMSNVNKNTMEIVGKVVLSVL